MKRVIFLVFIMSGAIFSTMSCSKDHDKDKPVVKYEVIESDRRVSSIDYTTASGENGYSDFPPANWSTEFRPEKKPFTAKLRVIFENTDNIIKMYTLNIRVNGEVKATKQYTLLGYRSGSATIEYLVE